MDMLSLDDLKTLSLELQEIVQCPVCLGPLNNTVVLCVNGHGVCGGCKSKLTQCPTCAAQFGRQKFTLLGQILEKLPQPCPFTGKGCSEVMLSNLKDHQSYCQFRPVDCKLFSCTWTGCLVDLLDHVRTSHKTNSFVCQKLGSKTNVEYPFNKTKDWGPNYNPYIFNLVFFWVCCYRDSKSKRLTFRFYYLPTSKPTENYYLNVSFINDSIEFKTTVKACVNMDNAHRAVDDNDTVFTIPDDLLDLFLKENTNMFKCTLEIIKKDFTF